MIKMVMVACTCVVIGLGANASAHLLGSPYLSKFLDANLLVILIALMAINTTTVSVILTKMSEIADRNPDVNFRATRGSMRRATVEQLVLVVIASFLLILRGSPLVLDNVPFSAFVIESLLVAVFAYAIQILHDTAKAVYVILDYEC